MPDARLRLQSLMFVIIRNKRLLATANLVSDQIRSQYILVQHVCLWHACL